MSFRWDSNNDNRIDAFDILAGFDKDGDQTLGKDELQELAAQLANQLEYNSNLLTQIHDSEQEKLNCQRELQSKQENLKRLSDMNENLRGELNESKRKLKVAQEVAESMSNQCRETRMELNLARREVENMQAGFQEMRAEVEESNDRIQELVKELNSAKQVAVKINDDAMKAKADAQSQIDVLRQMNEAVNKESADLRSKVFPLESDHRKLLSHIQDLTRSLDETTKRCEAEAQAHQAADRKVKELTTATEKLRDRNMELQYSLRESEDVVKSQKAKTEECSSNLEQAEGRMREMEEKITKLTQSLSMAKEDTVALQQELDHMANELVTQARLRQQDQERTNAKLTMERGEMERVIRDTKMHADDFAREAETRAAEANDARQRIEGKYLESQMEVNEMHALIDKMQKETQGNLQAWDTQKHNLLHSISQLQDKLEEAEERLENSTKDVTTEREKWTTALRSAKQELSQRGDRYVQTLSTLQLSVKKLRDEAITERNKVRELVGYISLIKGKSGLLLNGLAAPIGAIQAELKVVYEKLWNRCDEAKSSVEDAKDDLRRAQLAREEERSKTLMLEEQISRQELELAAKDRANAEIESRHQERHAAQKLKMDTMAGENAKLEEKIRLLQETLQATSAHAKNLQMSNQNMQSILGDETQKHSDRRQDVETKLAQLASQLRRTSQERDEFLSQLDELRSQFAQMKKDTESAKGMAQSATGDREAMNKEVESMKEKHQLAMTAVSSASMKYQQQLKQNQEILLVVQQQRTELQNQNLKLRAELDELYNSKRGVEDEHQ